MAKLIEGVVDTIRLSLNKNRRGHTKIEDIVTALKASERDLFRELLESYRKTKKIPNQLRPFIKVTADKTLTSGSVALEADCEEVIAVETKDTNYYPAELVNAEKFISQKLSDIIPDPENPNNPLHYNTKKETITLSSEVGDLPADFVKEISFEVAGEEGVILEADEFYDRANSKILAPSTTDPIAFIRDGQIEVLPTGLGNPDLIYIAHPVEKRAVAMVQGSNLLVNPTTATTAKYTYIATPTILVYATTTDGDGRGKSFNDGSSTDTDFLYASAGDLVARSLFYLGLRNQDDRLISAEAIKDRGDIKNLNNLSDDNSK